MDLILFVHFFSKGKGCVYVVPVIPNRTDHLVVGNVLHNDDKVPRTVFFYTHDY